MPSARHVREGPIGCLGGRAERHPERLRSAEVVMDVLGHTRMSTTSDLYTHVLHEVRVDAAQRMDTFIRGLDRAPEPE